MLNENELLEKERLNLNEKVIESLVELGEFLSKEQKDIVEKILKTLASYVVILGLAGTGKSRLIDGLIKVIKKVDKRYILLSTTGISALLHKEEMAQTIHQGMGNSARQVETRCYSMNPTPLFYLADFIIIDEVSMLTPSLWKALLHYKKREQKIVMFGDFSQLPPVMPGLKNNKFNSFSKMLFGFLNEDDVECIMLTENQRYVGGSGIRHAEIMRRVACEGYFKELDSYFSEDYYLKSNNPVEKERIMKVIIEKIANAADRQENLPLIVSTNKQVDEYNEMIIRNRFKDVKFTEYTTRYEEIDFESEETSEYLEQMKNEINNEEDYEKFIDKLKDMIKENKKNTDREVLPLRLCVGMKVMITANESVTLGEKRSYANGSIGTIVNLDKESVDIKLWNKNEDIVKITAVKTEHEVYLEAANRIVAYRYAVTVKFPIIIGYAFTVHKVQGMTVDEAFIDPEGCFEDGQFYTMISRVRTREGIHLLRKVKAKDIKVSAHVKAFYKYLEVNGKMYDSTITDYLGDRFLEIDRLDRLSEENRHYIKFNRLDKDKYVSYEDLYDRFTRDKIECTLSSLEYLNHLYDNDISFCDPRFIYVYAKAVEFGIRDCLEKWLDGTLEELFNVFKNAYPILRIPEISTSKEDAAYELFCMDIEEGKYPVPGSPEEEELDKMVDEYLEIYEPDEDDDWEYENSCG